MNIYVCLTVYKNMYICICEYISLYVRLRQRQARQVNKEIERNMKLSRMG